MKKPRFKKAFTLLELIVVVTLLTFLFGLGVGILTRIGFTNAFDAEAAHVTSMLRKARNFSRHRQAPSIIIVDPVSNTIYGKGLQTIGLWHFEDIDNSGSYDDGDFLALGARNINGTVFNAYESSGYIHQGLEFGTNPDLEGHESYMTVSQRSVLDTPLGFEISLWCFPGDFWSNQFEKTFNVTHQPDYEDFEPDDLDGRKKARLSAREKYRLWLYEKKFEIISKGDAFYVRMNGAYALEVGLHPYYYLKTPDDTLKPNMWNHVKVTYDCDRLVVTVNGVPYTIYECSSRYELKFVLRGEEISPVEVTDDIIEGAFPKKIYANDAPLMISSPVDSFYGRIDEVHVERFVAEDVIELSKVRLMGYGRKIYFTPQGKLDSEFHSSPALIGITDDPFYRPPEDISEEEAAGEPQTRVYGLRDVDEALEDEMNQIYGNPEDEVAAKARKKIISVDLNGVISSEEIGADEEIPDDIENLEKKPIE